MKKLILSILVLFVLSACGAVDLEPVETEMLEVSATPTATFAPSITPTQIPPTPTATIIPTVTPTPEPTAVPLPQGSEVISPSNAADLQVIGWVVNGSVAPKDMFYILDEGGEPAYYVLLTDGGFDTYTLDHELVSHVNIPGKTFTPYRVSTNGQYLALPANTGCTVEMWDLVAGQLVHTMTHDSPIAWDQPVYLMFNHASSQLVLGCYDNSIGIWDVETGQETVLDRTSQWGRFAFSNDDTMLAAANFHGNLEIYDITDLAHTELIVKTLGVGHVFENAFSPDDRYVVTMTDGKFAITDVQEKTLVGKFGMPEYSLAEFSADGDYVVVYEDPTQVDIQSWVRSNYDYMDGDETLYVYNYFTGYQVPEVDPVDVQAAMTSRPDFDQAELVERGYWSALAIDAVTDGVLIRSEGSEYRYWLNGEVELVSIPEALGNVSQGDQYLAYCTETGVVVEEISTGATTSVPGECVEPYLVAHNEKSTRVAFTSPSKIIEVVDWETGESLFRVGGFSYSALNLVFSQDGTHLAVATDAPYGAGITSGEIKYVYLNDETGGVDNIRLNLQGASNNGEISSIQIAPDNSWLLVVDPDTWGGVPDDMPMGESNVRLWDFNDAYTRIWSWSESCPRSAAINPAYDLMVFGTCKGKLFVVDLATQEVIADLTGSFAEPVTDIQFSVDGTSIYIQSGDAVSVWGVP